MENERNHNDAVLPTLCCSVTIQTVLDVTSTGVLQTIGKNSKTFQKCEKHFEFIKNLLCKQIFP